MKPVTRDELVSFLKNHCGSNPGFLERTKTIYRPRICPFERLLNLLPEGQRVLDIGCGAGVFLQLVANFRKPAALGGLEINPNAIERARRLFNLMHDGMPARLEPYDGTTLPAWIGEYDYVFLVDVIHHIPIHLQRKTLDSLFRALKPGARLIIKDIDADRPFWCLFNKLHDLLLAGQYPREISCSRDASSVVCYRIHGQGDYQRANICLSTLHHHF